MEGNPPKTRASNGNQFQGIPQKMDFPDMWLRADGNSEPWLIEAEGDGTPGVELRLRIVKELPTKGSRH